MKTKKRSDFHWNYRIFKDKDGELSVYETYYTNGKPDAIGRFIMSGESFSELLGWTEIIKRDFFKCQDDILDLEEMTDGKL